MCESAAASAQYSSKLAWPTPSSRGLTALGWLELAQPVRLVVMIAGFSSSTGSGSPEQEVKTLRGAGKLIFP